METTNKTKIPIILAVLVGLFVLVNLIWVDRKYQFDEPSIPQAERVEYVNLAGAVVKVDVVYTPEKLTKGLSGRENLLSDEGMLFVFSESAKYTIWMKEMNFSIDIIWLGEDGKIVHIKENATPESFPEVFAPETDAKYVLEVVAGFAAKNNLEVGDGVEFVLK